MKKKRLNKVLISHIYYISKQLKTKLNLQTHNKSPLEQPQFLNFASNSILLDRLQESKVVDTVGAGTKGCDGVEGRKFTWT